VAAQRSLPTTNVAGQPPATSATRDAARATLRGILLFLCLLALGRLVVTAFAYGIPAWFDEELNPLFNLLAYGQPITQIDARQYGVVVFLALDPAVRLLGPNPSALAIYAAVLSLLAALGGFALIAWRYATDDQGRLLLLGLAWFSAVPLLYVVAQHMVDAWQVCFIAASLFLLTGSPRQQRLAGVPLAAATMTKLLPGFLLFYVCLRSWRTGLIGVAALSILLALGQVLYGPLMGFGYPLAVLAGGGDTVARWSTHFENNSVRGLLFKLAAGFHLQGDTTTYVLDPTWYPWLNALAYGLAAALLGYLLWAVWRGRGDGSAERRAIEFSLASVTMLLISPHTAQDYLVTVLPVFGVWLYLRAKRKPRPWTFGQTLLASAAALLIGVFVPMNLAARVIPFGALLSLTHNAQNVLFADQIGSAIGAYDFFGFPGLGLLLAWLALARLERMAR
jgi:Glycosyltransferase family 87